MITQTVQQVRIAPFRTPCVASALLAQLCFKQKTCWQIFSTSKQSRSCDRQGVCVAHVDEGCVGFALSLTIRHNQSSNKGLQGLHAFQAKDKGLLLLLMLLLLCLGVGGVGAAELL